MSSAKRQLKPKKSHLFVLDGVLHATQRTSSMSQAFVNRSQNLKPYAFGRPTNGSIMRELEQMNRERSVGPPRRRKLMVQSLTTDEENNTSLPPIDQRVVNHANNQDLSLQYKVNVTKMKPRKMDNNLSKSSAPSISREDFQKFILKFKQQLMPF